MMEHSFNWVMTCIEGSKSSFQINCCRTLIGLFETMYKDVEESPKEMITELYDALDKQEIKHGLDA